MKKKRKITEKNGLKTVKNVLFFWCFWAFHRNISRKYIPQGLIVFLNFRFLKRRNLKARNQFKLWVKKLIAIFFYFVPLQRPRLGIKLQSTFRFKTSLREKVLKQKRWKWLIKHIDSIISLLGEVIGRCINFRLIFLFSGGLPGFAA